MREEIKVYVPNFLVVYYNKKIRKKPWKYEKIAKSLAGARLPITTQRFLAIVSFYSLISFVSGVIAGYILIRELIRGNTFMNILTYVFGNLPQSYEFIISNYTKVAYASLLLGSLISGLIAYKFVRYLILSYPSFVSSRRRGEIDIYLPHAINMMYGMAVGGIGTYEIIRTIAESRTMFGELSKEFSVVLEMTDVFREDLISSLRFVRDTTPSERLSGFLDDFIFILRGGGRTSDFLKSKSEEYLEEQESSFSSYLDFLGVMAEFYLAVFVLLPLFLLVVLVVMQMVGTALLEMYKIGITIVLPAATILFVYLIKSSLPIPRVKTERKEEMVRERLKVPVKPGTRESFRIKKFKRIYKKVKNFVLHPFVERTIYTLQFRIVAFHILVFALIVFVVMSRYLSLEEVTVLTTSAIFVPFIVLIELRERAIRNIEKKIPDFFRELAILNEAGLNVIEALKALSSVEIGIISREISVMRREIEWGGVVTRAFRRFEMRVRSDVVAKVVPIAIKALETSPTFKDAFQTVANFAASEIRLKEKIRTSMMLYTIIIYVSIFIFLLIDYVLIKNILSIFGGIAVSDISGITFAPNIELVKETFFYVSIVVGSLSGIIAGVIGSGKVESGLKHSYVFLIATYIMFRYLLS